MIKYNHKYKGDMIYLGKKEFYYACYYLCGLSHIKDKNYLKEIQITDSLKAITLCSIIPRDESHNYESKFEITFIKKNSGVVNNITI